MKFLKVLLVLFLVTVSSLAESSHRPIVEVRVRFQDQEDKNKVKQEALEQALGMVKEDPCLVKEANASRGEIRAEIEYAVTVDNDGGYSLYVRIFHKTCH